jgi:hypothetical protein
VGVRVAAVGVSVGGAKRDLEQPATHRMQIIMKENLIALFKTRPLAMKVGSIFLEKGC